jgi:hypothetical protein
MHRWIAWNAKNAKTDVKVFGALNDPDDKDKYVTMELRISFADLPSLKGKLPKVGDNWKFSLFRTNYSVNLPVGVESSVTSPMSKNDFADFNEWVLLKFVK